jgi:hypothetical protein
LTVVELTVISAPKLAELTPLIKFDPLRTTSSVCPRLPLLGERLVKLGAGLFTVKLCVFEVPPPGLLLVTEKFRAPVAARAVMVRLAVKLVELVTICEFTVMPAPTLTELTPLIKFVPGKTTSNVCKRFPLAGERLVKVGAGLPTVKI